MALVVNTNVTALAAHRNLFNNARNVQKSMERLASGYRINRAGDDAAGTIIAENLSGQIRGYKKALQNAQDGFNMLQIAEGGANVILENLQRIRELAIQGANDTNSQAQRDAIAREVRARAEDIERISQATEYNGLSLLDGYFTELAAVTLSTPSLQIGTTSDTATSTINITRAFESLSIFDDKEYDSTNGYGEANAAGNFVGGLAIINHDDNTGSIGNSPPLVNPAVDMGVAGTMDFADLDDIWDFTTNTTLLDSGDNFRTLIDMMDSSIQTVTNQLSDIGAFTNQLESVVSNITTAIENFSASHSRIKDLDVAAESTNLVKNQILQQAAISVLSQANQIPALTLSLLQA